MQSDIQDKIQTALARISAAIERTKPIAVFGLFSGGHDSVTATTVASLHPKFTSAVHINTGIGVARTRQYVRETCALKGWTLAEYEAAKNVNGKGKPDPQIYRELVMKLGFPGPHGHGMMYARLKERCLRMLQREWKAIGNKKRPRRVMYISGCRSEESMRRMANTKEVQIDGQRIWCAPIHDWSKEDCHALMEHCSVPRNPVVDLIHKSGECLCGAFAQKGELEELKLHPETRPAYDELVAIQADVIAAGLPWGWEDAPPAWYQEKKRGTPGFNASIRLTVMRCGTSPPIIDQHRVAQAQGVPFDCHQSEFVGHLDSLQFGHCCHVLPECFEFRFACVTGSGR